MGMVKAGIATYSSFAPSISERYAFPFNFGWPLRIFMLDRCFMTTRLKTSNGKELVLINTHNSAFDDNGSIRKAELGYFRNFLVDEYKKGNYVIVGGDFNQCPVGINTDFGIQPFDFDDYVSIPDSLLPIDWKYIFDNKTPSNRRVATPYKKGETKITLIDFFIVSPNVKAEEIVCVDLDFRHSNAQSRHRKIQVRVKNQMHKFSELLKITRPHWKLFITAPLLVLTEVSAELAQPELMAEIVNRGVIGGEQNVIFPIGMKMLAITLLGMIGGILSIYAAGKVAYTFGSKPTASHVRENFALLFREHGQTANRIAHHPHDRRCDQDSARDTGFHAAAF